MQSASKPRKREIKAQLKSKASKSSKEKSTATLKKKGGIWTDDEHKKFIEAVRIYGKNWSKITEYIGTREKALVASHAQNFRRKFD